jgi:putative hydrolase of the HAD superfamily
VTEFDQFAALSFDCYGTLIDWETGFVEALRPWTARHGIADDALLEAIAAHETVVESEHPTTRYPDVLAETLQRVADQFGVDASAEERAAFGASVPDWPAFPDSHVALTALQRRFRLIILSNIDRTSFAASARRLGIEFDLVITAEDVGSYKPDPANFAALLDGAAGVGIERAELVHVAQSLYHDHVPAKAIGLPTAWIDRRHGRAGTGATPGAAPVTPDWRFASMAAFAEAAAG